MRRGEREEGGRRGEGREEGGRRGRGRRGEGGRGGKGWDAWAKLSEWEVEGS